jgi:curved DNA-binding protein CbpA
MLHCRPQNKTKYPGLVTTPEPTLSPEEESLLAESVDLEVDMRRLVLRMHREMATLDHYALLGVDRTADRKVLKRSYFELASKLHPDKYFRKKLGSFKMRMEEIFSRITLAHDTLGNKDKRAEYDAYLEELRRSRGMEELMADAMAEVKRAEEVAEREAQEAEQEAAAASPAAPPATPAPKAASVDVAMSARRDALARRLLGGRSLPPSRPPPAPSPVPPRPSSGEAMGALRRRYEERKSRAKATQARVYVTKGQEALATGDAVSAANAFRVAMTLNPEDPELQRTTKEAQAKADEMLAATYEKQASYEEKNGQWVEAARSWARVCRVRPGDIHAHERGANAIVKAEGDLHEAARLAQRACELEPKNPRYRVTLANVYLAAGLALNARRELETAAQQAPQDGSIQAMLKRVGKPA